MRGKVVTAGLGAFVPIAMLCATTAWAQGTALSRFDPSERGSRYFIADSLELGDGTQGQKARVAAGIASTYALRTRVFGSELEGENTRLVEHAFYVHPGGSVTVAPGARFALDVPIAWQAGEDTNLANHAYQKPPSPRFGDVRAAFDLRLAALGPVTLAGGVMGYLPTGSLDAFTGDDFVRFGLRFAASVHEGPFHFATRVGYMYRREGFVGGVTTGSEVNGVLAAAFSSGIFFVGPEIWASTYIDDAFEKRATPVEALIGGHATFGELRGGIGIGRSVTAGLGSTYLRLVLSLEWVNAPRSEKSDRDGDGIPDAMDPCPDVSGPAGGCPIPPTDRDGDGIFDSDDACPDQAGVRTRDPRTHGCPQEPIKSDDGEPTPSPPIDNW